MIIDDSALEKINELDKKYKELTGRPINYKFLPKNVTQEQVVECLELMVAENLAITVAYEKLYGRKKMLNDFSSQTEIVIKNLIDNGYTKQQALDLWNNSKTYNEIIKQQLYYVSVMRALWELKLELSNDSRWFNEPFDM